MDVVWQIRVCFKFDIYVGKTEEVTTKEEGSLGFRVINKLMDGLEGKNHKLFLDNFFNSVDLMEGFKNKSIFAVDKINTSRRLIPCPKALTEYNENMNNVNKVD